MGMGTDAEVLGSWCVVRGPFLVPGAWFPVFLPGSRFGGSFRVLPTAPQRSVHGLAKAGQSRQRTLNHEPRTDQEPRTMNYP